MMFVLTVIALCLVSTVRSSTIQLKGDEALYGHLLNPISAKLMNKVTEFKTTVTKHKHDKKALQDANPQLIWNPDLTDIENEGFASNSYWSGVVWANTKDKCIPKNVNGNKAFAVANIALGTETCLNDNDISVAILGNIHQCGRIMLVYYDARGCQKKDAKIGLDVNFNADIDISIDIGKTQFDFTTPWPFSIPFYQCIDEEFVGNDGSTQGFNVFLTCQRNIVGSNLLADGGRGSLKLYVDAKPDEIVNGKAPILTSYVAIDQCQKFDYGSFELKKRSGDGSGFALKYWDDKACKGKADESYNLPPTTGEKGQQIPYTPFRVATEYVPNLENKCLWQGCGREYVNGVRKPNGDDDECEFGTYCDYSNPWYSQCKESTAGYEGQTRKSLHGNKACVKTNNNNFQGPDIKDWGCKKNKDCCNPYAECIIPSYSTTGEGHCELKQCNAKFYSDGESATSQTANSGGCAESTTMAYVYVLATIASILGVATMVLGYKLNTVATTEKELPIVDSEAGVMVQI